MNYYPFHIGDYATHTAHLEPLEDLAYRRLLDLYYLREGELPLDVTECARLVRMRSDVDLVGSVLNEFFDQTPTGWYSERCSNELERMLDKQAKAQASARASVAARKAKAEQPQNDGPTTVQRPLSDRSTDVELPTPTPTPTPINKNTGASAKRGKPAVDRPEGVSETVWADFLVVRKAKRAPLTATALQGIEREATKAGIALADALAICCARGWQGFKAEWVQGQMVASTQGTETNYQRAMREEVEAWAPSVAKKAPIQLRPVGQVFDAELVTTTPKALGVA